MVKLQDVAGIYVLVDIGLQGIETTILSLLGVVLTHHTQELPAPYQCFSAQACQMNISFPLLPGLNPLAESRIAPQMVFAGLLRGLAGSRWYKLLAAGLFFLFLHVWMIKESKSYFCHVLLAKILMVCFVDKGILETVSYTVLKNIPHPIFCLATFNILKFTNHSRGYKFKLAMQPSAKLYSLSLQRPTRFKLHYQQLNVCL